MHTTIKNLPLGFFGLLDSIALSFSRWRLFPDIIFTIFFQRDASILIDKIKNKRCHDNQKIVQLPRASTWSKNARKVNSTQSASVYVTWPMPFLYWKGILEGPLSDKWLNSNQMKVLFQTSKYSSLYLCNVIHNLPLLSCYQGRSNVQESCGDNCQKILTPVTTE